MDTDSLCRLIEANDGFHEWYEERVAILIYDAGYKESRAEDLALEMAIKYFGEKNDQYKR